MTTHFSVISRAAALLCAAPAARGAAAALLKGCPHRRKSGEKDTGSMLRRFIPFIKQHPLVPVITLSGTISTGKRGLNDARLAPVIEKAFRMKPTCVALIVNSPGGSPVQSSLIAARIRRLAESSNVPVHTFVEDVAASGGYWLACAGDKIWADRSSIVGSIGVIAASFGFSQLMERQGIERRVVTAGKSKSFADPFLPQKPEDIERIRAIQAPIHESFIAHVKARRGSCLADGDLFNADIWVGEQAVKMGLVDGIAHLVPKMKELYGQNVKLVDLGPKQGVFGRFGVNFADEALHALEDRTAFARFGL